MYRTPTWWGTLQQRADPFDAGPYIRVQRSIGLIGADAPRAGRRAALAGLVAWVPLILLSAVQGIGIGPTPQESMWLDIAAHARYLLAIPLLVLAERFCLPGLAAIANHFGEANLVSDASRPRYQELLDSSRRLLASPVTDITIIALAYLLTVAQPLPIYAGNDSTWVGSTISPDKLSLAGWWRLLVSQPLFSILQIAWVWRIAVWGRFLYGISRLELNLNPAHPDRAAGLGFLGGSLREFLAPAFALTVPLAGAIAQEILRGGRNIDEFRYDIGGALLFEVLLFTAPLLFLTPQLIRERTRGVFQYGALATVVGQRFELRWIESIGAAAADRAMSSPDFSATTDLYSIAANVNQMQLVPVRLFQIGRLIVAAGLPFLPVLATAMPVKDIFGSIVKLVL
jgi:hypothetical protein